MYRVNGTRNKSDNMDDYTTVSRENHRLQTFSFVKNLFIAETGEVTLTLVCLLVIRHIFLLYSLLYLKFIICH
jgi:hypothetical protein